MKSPHILCRSILAAASLAVLTSLPAFSAEPAGFATIKSQADVDALVASTKDAGLKQAIKDNAAAIVAAADKHAHVEAVLHTIELSPGKAEKINTTPEALKKAAGGEIGLFDTLKLVDLSIPNAGPHDARKTDPYDLSLIHI